jgi:hypothetical protein
MTGLRSIRKDIEAFQNQFEKMRKIFKADGRPVVQETAMN